MRNRAIISTHHKTGTTWMGMTFRQLCRELDIPFCKLEVRGEVPAPPAVIHDSAIGWFRAFNDKNRLPTDRALHLIRDPRDVVISGMHHHKAAREKWLHRPREGLGGLTYQQYIIALPDDSARYAFELEHGAVKAITQMMRWETRPESFECRYEDLIQDIELVLWRRAVEHLGFVGGNKFSGTVFLAQFHLQRRQEARKAHSVRRGGTMAKRF